MNKFKFFDPFLNCNSCLCLSYLSSDIFVFSCAISFPNSLDTDSCTDSLYQFADENRILFNLIIFIDIGMPFVILSLKYFEELIRAYFWPDIIEILLFHLFKFFLILLKVFVIKLILFL